MKNIEVDFKSINYLSTNIKDYLPGITFIKNQVIDTNNYLSVTPYVRVDFYEPKSNTALIINNKSEDDLFELLKLDVNVFTFKSKRIDLDWDEQKIKIKESIRYSECKIAQV